MSYKRFAAAVYSIFRAKIVAQPMNKNSDLDSKAAPSRRKRSSEVGFATPGADRSEWNIVAPPDVYHAVPQCVGYFPHYGLVAD